MAGGDIRRLTHMLQALRPYVAAYREALRALHATGTSIKPPATRLVEWLPEPILVRVLRFFFDARLAFLGESGTLTRRLTR